MQRALVLLALAGAALACNGGPADDPDCQHNDRGSCGTACCKLSFTFKGASPTEVKDALQNVLSNGGPDGRYALQTTARGTFGFTDEFTKPPYHYVGQAYHTTPFPDGQAVTSGPYRDTVNFLIYEKNNATTVRGFSLSQINGALGDNSINFKNLMQVFRAAQKVDAVKYDWTMEQEDGSCPAGQ